MECKFHVGMRVRCVDDQMNISSGKLPEIIAGHVYTIRQVGPHSVSGLGIVDDQISVWLEGIERPHALNAIVIDLGFRPSRFRPVVERKTSIAIFHEILSTQRVRQPA